MASYTVILERDESGAWIARVKNVPGCHTYGRSIAQALDRAREALGLWVEDANEAELVPSIRLPSELRKTAAEGRAARKKAADAQVEAHEALAAAALTLTKGGLSRRDAASLLGISHQRVQQLLYPAPG